MEPSNHGEGEESSVGKLSSEDHHDKVTTANGNGLSNTTPVAAPNPFSEGVKTVTDSEIAVQTLLNRLKQSISSAKEFAQFLKRRSGLEEDHANGLRKLCQLTHSNLKKPECRGGSLGVAFDEMFQIHETMAANSNRFSGSMAQMADDLQEMAANSEKGRKYWKQGLTAEQRHQDTELACRKAKSKLDSIAEDYDKTRTGDRQGGKIFGIKGPKSAAQHEEDLLRKVQAADADYAQKVQSAQASRAELLTRGRPEAVKNLLELLQECDSALTLQMQKFASFNEKLLLHNGLAVSPLKGPDGEVTGRSLRDVVAAVDNERDMNYYISSYASKAPPIPAETRYERHSVLSPAQSVPPPQVQRQPESAQTFNSRQGPPLHQGGTPQQHQPISMQSSPGPNPMTQNPPGQSPSSQHLPGSYPKASQVSVGQGQNPTSMAQRPLDNRNLNQGPPPSMQPQDRSFSMGQHQQPPSQYSSNSMGRSGPAQASSQTYNTGSIGSSGPPQLSSLPFQNSAPLSASFQQGGNFSSPQNSNYQTASAVNQSAGNLPPLKPVFGMTLEQLFDRDGSAVPMVVYQCIQAVDLFGLEVEGIYRMSGTSSHVNKIKALFDNDSSKVDFRNPESFFHDVNSVAGLLKQFFRDLPDPLLTAEHYTGFIDAAKNDDDIVRRDSLHAIINSLPDPNYATLRALTLHLNRVHENSASNRMNASNLAIVFGPTLMGANTGPNIQDAGWQVRVIDTILNNTYQIFDDD